MDEENRHQDGEGVTTTANLSNILIGVLLIVVAFLAFNFFQGDNANSDENTSPTPTGYEITDQNISDNQDVMDAGDQMSEDENTYTVVEGDSLWKIAQNELNDGFLWTEIAKLNDIDATSAGTIEKGTKLFLPEVAGASDTNDDAAMDQSDDQMSEDEMVQDESGETKDQLYVVKEGDTLWSIAKEFYGDGNRWHEIFDLVDNSLSMYTARDGHMYPIIFQGNVLIVPAVAS
ncbi:LysM peptidoglycan-binding domain-containing protein [candidate division WWE3 bacterium]|uniref:LysM peptidoglycan-binding domain-containing protein n=1 Tax=candidate division WWE3 bacterium TaxID=2053526 RepID=A0A955LK13_UNCKA|nr:LysM peptidoglycan-binding domain-containing protein [candidate division WWE3 bacterium]